MAKSTMQSTATPVEKMMMMTDLQSVCMMYIIHHTSYLSRTPRTMSVEKFCVMWKKFRCGDFLDVKISYMK